MARKTKRARKTKKAKKGRNSAPETQAYVWTGLGFLSLPAELRNMVYRLLLVSDKPLGNEVCNEVPRGVRPAWWAYFRQYDLQPAILRTCRQVHREARSILDGENTVGIHIYGSEVHHFSYDVNDYFELKRVFMNFEFGRDSGKCIPCIERFQRFEIVIDTANLEIEAVEHEVETLCSSLCTIPALQHLSLHLWECHKNSHLSLGPFGTLRNMRSVVIHGAPLPFAERLKRLMIGNTPQENVKEMYRLLENFVQGPKGDLSDLKKATIALKEWDFQNFIEIRSKLIFEGQNRMRYALRHICDSDPKNKLFRQVTNGDSDRKNKLPRQVTIDKYYKPKTAADHDGEIGVPLPFAERSKELMIGNTPQENVKEMMYRLLEKFVQGPKGSLSDLKKASIALKEWDFQKFREIRSKLLSEGQNRMRYALRHIRYYDPKSKLPRQATIDEYCKPKTAEDHDGEIEDKHLLSIGRPRTLNPLCEQALP
ncbi:hypothetical protein MMC07_005532 [Pseudocyphellaria aurata]|nr:hypothetical protein [Pseudocyphellaria aurata]